ncbi:MAG: PAS domain-containing protein, partial [Bacillota bacterium]
VNITDYSKPNISESYLKKWQNILNITKDIIGIDAALIMKITSNTLEVFVKSENKENPYKVGDSENLGKGLYCETVIGKDKELFIKNSFNDKDWKNNPDIDLNMISYYGMPIKWPDGEVFGTFCILDSSQIQLNNHKSNIFKSFKDIIEQDLNSLVKQTELNNFFEINLDLLCIANLDGEFVKVNSSWQDLLGYTTEKLEGMSFLDFVHPQDLKPTNKAISRLNENKDVINFVNRFKDKNGKYHFIEWKSKIKKNHIYAAARDITKRLLDKEKLKKQKKRLNWIIEGTDAGTWEWNIVTDKTTFNEKWAEMLGYNLEEILPTSKKTLEEFIHPKDLKKVDKNLKEHFNGKSDIYDVEIRMKHKNGNWIWINARGKVIDWTKDNKPLKMFGTHINITKRKKKENKLKETQDLVKNLTDQAPGLIYQFKLLPNGKYVFPYVSKGIEKIYEVSSDKAILDAQKVLSRIHPDDYEKVIESIEISAKNLSIWYNVHRVILPKKGLRWLKGEASPEKLKDGSILWHGSVRDITKKQKQHEFQKILAEISSSLLKIDSLSIDKKLNNTLKNIGEFLNVDQGFVFKFSENNKFMSNIHQWNKKGSISNISKIQNIPVINFWMEKFSEDKFINISNLDELTKSAKDQMSILNEYKIKSIFCMPIFIENKLFGFIGFNTFNKKRIFSKEEIRLLKIFKDVITSAFSKYIYDKKINKLTYNDSLTGLFNRRFFEKELTRLDTKRQIPISVIVADINGLKIINDSLGHEKGDKLLIKSANILKSLLRKEDILARQGGDEFAILLPQTKSREAEDIISRIKSVSKKTKGDELTVSIALGTATKTKINQDIYEILKKADNNMYQNKLSESKSAKNKMVKSLLNTLAVKSNETKKHAKRMTDLSKIFGKKLGLSNYELNRLVLLSTLHDIGKTTISEEILKKPGKLTEEEWKIVKKHSESGYRIANSSQEFALVAEDIYAHHEKWSGDGYPRELKGKEIPYLARIICIIDAYDVMTHDQPYKKAISKKAALNEIKRCAGSQFDPKLAEIFIEMMKKIKNNKIQ